MISDVPDETQHVPDGPLKAVVASSPSPHPKFGRYATSGTLGAGAMGTVYRARDEALGRDVAIKSLTASGELGVRERFLREARAIGAVRHPNILAVHDVGEEGATPYLVMEIAEGGSLRERVKAGALPVETVRDVGIQIARALAAAHAAGIVHRDVKPANILCVTPTSEPPLWKLADFGIAHVPDSTLTMTGQFLGSPSYAAPECLRSGEFGPSSDVYSLAATLYEALAGTPPHGNHDMQSLVRKLEQEPTPLAQKNPAAPRALADPIMAALAVDPTKRPSADELARMLADESSLKPVPVPVPASGGPSMKLLAFGLLAIATLAIILALRERSSSSPSGAPSPALLKPPTPSPSSAAAEDEEHPAQGPQPMVLDQYGNPVDEETAKQILEQMEQDALDAYERPGRGRGKKKWKNRE
jgi:serine/threonine-protein kinase